MKKFSLIFSLVVALFASFFLSGCEEKDPNAVEKNPLGQGYVRKMCYGNK